VAKFLQKAAVPRLYQRCGCHRDSTEQQESWRGRVLRRLPRCAPKSRLLKASRTPAASRIQKKRRR